MKRILSTLTLLLCFALTAVNAQVITAERAAEIANSFFSAGMQKSAAARGVVASSNLTTSFDSNDVVDVASAEPTFYVLTNPEGGFVIVSGEETENPIIGYSLDGAIDVNNLSDGFVGYMTDIDAQVKALREYNANNPQKSAAARSAMVRAADYEYNATSMGNIVKNLNTAPWGQGEPFNNLCYVGATGTTSKAKTGCGPTAFAILCYYYKWPASGAGKVTHQTTGENMELGHTYDYASMRNDNYQSGYSEAEANAIALLMRDLGWANQVGYGTSSTSFSETAQHMVDHFRFKSVRPVDHGASLAVVRSTLGNDTQWKTYIKNNLDAGYPIPYASTTDASNSARHIYILDGYTDNDYYHFNWGWSGQGNGWFTLDNMVPDNSSNYSNSHKAYYIIPDATTYTVTATTNSSSMGAVSINGGTAGNTATADLLQGTTATLTAHPADGYALASWTKNGVVVGSKNSIQVMVGESDNDYVANFAEASTVTVIQDYTINATSGTALTPTTKVKEWAFNANNDYPAALKLTSTTESINTNNAGDCIQLYLMSGTTATYTLSVPEDYEITQYTIRCKTAVSSGNPYITEIAAEGQTYTPTSSYADYTFTKSALARSSANTTAITITGTQYRALQVESISVTVAKEGAEGTVTPEPEQPSTPTTYTVTTTANPAAGGTAKFAVGTGSQKTQGDVENGTQITLYAVANTGYNFVNWTLGGNVVSNSATCHVNVAQAANYVANFEADVPAEPATNLAGKYFRLKQKGTTNYMNIANNTAHTSGTVGGVNVTSTLNDEKQVFCFDGNSTTGYKLKSKGGYYITCQPWNVDAISTEDGTLLTFETAGADNEYYIKWDNKNMNGTVERDDYFKAENGYVYCDAASGDATTWVLDEVKYTISTVASPATAGTATVNGAAEASVSLNAQVELKATVTDNSYKFKNWTLNGAEVSTSATYTVSATANATYTANFEKITYSITATAGNGGSVLPTTSTVEHGASVTLTATANAGYHFVNWTKGGVEVSTAAECTIDNVTEAGEYVANFAINTYAISVSANGTGGNAMIGTGTSTTVNYGGSVTLTAAANAGYHFVNWTKGGVEVSTAAECTIDNVTEAGEYVANFAINTYAISVSANGTGGNAMIGTGTSTTVNYGGSVTLTAAANAGYHFVNWTKGGVEVSTAAECTIDNVTEAGEYVANFAINTYAISVSANGTGGNAMIGTGTSTTVNYGGSVTLTAAANAGYHFVNWTKGGVEVSTAAECTIDNVTEAGEYVANFAINTYAISVSANGTGGNAMIGTGTSTTVNHGASVTLTATANDGYEFVSWTKGTDVVSTNASYEFNATADGEYIANFQAIQQGGETTDPLAGKWFRLKEKTTGTYMNIYDNDTHIEGARGGVNVATLKEDSNGQIFQFIKHNNAYYLQSRTDYYINCQAWNVDANSTTSGAELTLEPTAEELEYLIKCSNGYFKIDDVKENPSLGKFVYCDAALTAATTWALEEFIEDVVSTYTISVNAGEGGSASIGTETNITVEHGTSVTLTATANDGYEFVNWTKGGVIVSTDANYKFMATADGEYTANFQLINVTYYNVVVNSNIAGSGIAFIETGTSTDVTSGRYQAGSTITLKAVSDKGENGYLFTGWYIGDELISPDKMYTVTLDGDVTYTAKFEAGWRVTYSCNYRMGYIKVYDNDGADIGGTNYVLVKKGATIQMVGAPERGYQFKDWTANATGDFVTAENPYYLTVDGNKTIYANFEPKSYVLTVTANDDSYGTVSVESGEFSSDTSVKVGISMIATITAEANDGYEFVNWTTKDGVEVSKEATYVIEAIEIENVDAMKDVEYVAVFKKQVGTYYRIAYNFEVPVETPAKSAATRAAGDTYTYTLTPQNIGLSSSNNSTSSFDYTGTNPVALRMAATISNGDAVNGIQRYSNNVFKLMTSVTSPISTIKYTISAPEGYIISNYSFKYNQRSTNNITLSYNDQAISITTTTAATLSVEPNAQTAEFTLTSSTYNTNAYLLFQEFTVTIQEVGSGEGEGSEGEGGKTPELETKTVKYYVQSEACGVDGKDKALVMKPAEENGGASSIFYYAGNELMSYSTGTFVNENGNTRGLQDIGATVGKVKIESNKIEFTNGTNVAYMHAKESNGIYYVDNCGATATCGKDDHNFILEEVTSLPVTITSAGYATWYAPVAVELPTGVTAYTITIDGDYAITGEGFKTVPANTGVILAGTQGTYDLAITTTTDEVESILEGTVAAAILPNESAYVLSNDKGNKELGFYLANDGQASYSHKAYLPKSALTPAMQMSTGFRLMLPGTTAVEKVESRNEKEEIYDLTGRKLEGISGTGIYIINGKKVIIR